MSIDVLIQGRIHRTPQSRTSSSGKTFAIATVRTATRDGGAIFASVIAFSTTAVTALLALSEGDAVAIAGEATLKVFTPRDGGEPRPSLDLLAHRVLSEYDVQRTKKAAAAAKSEERHDFDDDLPDVGGAHR